jgi:hypothetical protein
VKAPEARQGYADRGMVFPAYPTEDQVAKIEAMQPSLRAAWNWLVSRIEDPLKAHEAKLVRDGLLPPAIPRPEYSGLQPEEAKTRKQEYTEACRKRRQEIFNSPVKVEWRPFLSGKGSEAERLGLSESYQVINNYLSDKGLPCLPAALLRRLELNFKFKPTGDKRKRRKQPDCVMPIQTSSGDKIRLIKRLAGNWLSRRCNAEVHLPSVGWIAVYLDPGLVNILLTPGNTVREGCTLRYEHGRWYASVKVIRREKMHPGPGDGSHCGIDPGLAKLATVSDGTVLPNKRNLRYAEARELALGIADIHPDKEERSWIREFVFRQDFRQRRRTLTQCRQLAAKLSRQYDFIGIEANTGIALGSGSRYVGATKTLLQCLIHRCGTNRVREIDSHFNSQDCSQCGFRSKETWQRRLGESNQTCKCTHCGIELDRDLNAARNVDKRLAEALSLS